MAIFAIPKQYYQVINISFELSEFDKSMGLRFVSPKYEFKAEDIIALRNPPESEWLAFDTLTDAKLTVILLSRLYSGESQLIADQVKMFASPVIFKFTENVDQNAPLQVVDASTLAEYPIFTSIPCYMYESIDSEKAYMQKVIKAFAEDPVVELPLFRKHKIAAKDAEKAFFMDATGEFKTQSLAPALALASKYKLNVGA
ncbi:MAG TPA: hypothetical protein VLG38_04670 [Gammaproteobacteria bacterium]|nr:hypothetical protein [Gammaproteobacteria bacterium]